MHPKWTRPRCWLQAWDSKTSPSTGGGSKPTRGPITSLPLRSAHYLDLPNMAKTHGVLLAFPPPLEASVDSRGMRSRRLGFGLNIFRIMASLVCRDFPLQISKSISQGNGTCFSNREVRVRANFFVCKVPWIFSLPLCPTKLDSSAIFFLHFLVPVPFSFNFMTPEKF